METSLHSPHGHLDQCVAFFNDSVWNPTIDSLEALWVTLNHPGTLQMVINNLKIIITSLLTGASTYSKNRSE